MSKTRSRLLNTIKAPVLDWLSLAGGGPGPFAPSPHPLSSGHHSGELANAQAPQFLLRDGSRSLTGNLAIEPGILIGGVNLPAHVGDENAHHNRVHGLDGADHTGTLSWAKVNKSGSRLDDLATRPHSHLTNIGANDHHNRLHNIASTSDHTATGSAWQVVGLTATNTIGLLDSASNPGANERLLRSTAAGGLTLEGLTVRGNVDVINGGDLTVGTLLQANVTQGSVGFNRAADPQFSVDVAGALRADWLVGPHAIQLSGALMICHYDGPGPFELDFTGTAVGHMGQAPTTETAVIYRPGKFGGKALQTSSPAVNLVPNPRFEINTTGWVNVTGGSINRDTAEAFLGDACLRKETGGSSFSGARTNSLPVSASTPYTAHARIKADAGQDVRLRLQLLTDADESLSLADTTITGNGDWQYVAVTHTGEERAANARLLVVVPDAVVTTFYLDAVMLVAGEVALPYIDGAMPGVAWSGTAHNSTSSHSGHHLIYDGGALKADQGTYMAWVKTVGGDTVQNLWRVDGSSGFLRTIVNSSLTVSAQWGTSGFATSAAALDLDRWYHIAQTYDGTTTRLYIDGQEVDSAANSGFAGPDLLYVGRQISSVQWLNGRIDDLAIIDHALEPEEILAIYESNAPVFAESSTWHFQTPGDVPVWADERGLFVRDTEGGAVLGVIGRDASSWGGRSNDAGDLLIGDVNQGNYLLWDRDIATLTIGGTVDSLDIASGSVLLDSSGVNFRAQDAFIPSGSDVIHFNEGSVTGPQVAGIAANATLLSGPFTRLRLFVNDHTNLSNEKAAIVLQSSGGSPTPSNIRLMGTTRVAGTLSAEKGINLGTDFPGIGDEPQIRFTAASGTPTWFSPGSANLYLRNNKLIIQFRDGSFTRYKYLDLTGTGTTWTHTTTAP
jgi:hypothetical protein